MSRNARYAAVVLGLLTGAIAGCTRPTPRTHKVSIQNFVFVPAEVIVAPGDTVIWSNTDFVPHSATARDASWDSKAIGGSEAWRFVAETPGRHEYYCVFHPNMTATIVVR